MHKHTHTQLYIYLHLRDLLPAMCTHISLSVLKNLKTVFFSYLYSSDNKAGQIPETPSAVLNIVLSSNIGYSGEPEDHAHCKHK